MLLRRALAYFLDVVICFVAFIALQFALFVPSRSALGITEEWFLSGLNTELYTLLTISLPVWAYFTLAQASVWQATPGMRVFKLGVRNLASGSISLGQAFVRTIVLLLPWELAHITNNLPQPIWYDPNPGFRFGFALVAIVGAANVSSILLRRDRRGLHDLAASTAIEERK